VCEYSCDNATVVSDQEEQLQQLPFEKEAGDALQGTTGRGRQR
jgi:hypothetical protein